MFWKEILVKEIKENGRGRDHELMQSIRWKTTVNQT